MKILFVIDKMLNYAGIERILSCKMNYLAEQPDYEIYLTTYEQKKHKLPYNLNNKISYKPLDASLPQRSDNTLYKWLTKYIQTRKLFKKQFQKITEKIQPDIVICTVYSFQVLDIIINTTYHINAKSIIESHTKGETVTIAYKFQYNRLLHKILSLWDNHIMKSLIRSNCIVTLTNEDTYFWSPYAKEIRVIPNMLTIKPKIVKDYNTKRVISAGRYMSEKGFDMLLEAWNLLSIEFADWQLYIYGNGNRTPFQNIVNKYKMSDQVHLMPATKDIAKEFSESSIYVMSSRYEGFGLVLAEAMSCGLPCISFDCPYGPREIITDGEDGILVEDGNINVLAQKMENLMADSTLRKAMGTKAIQNIARYNPEAIMNRWITLFNNI